MIYDEHRADQSYKDAYYLGMFLLVWFGQVASLLGSGLTNFALGVWVYLRTGSVTEFAFISFSTILPVVIISPIAGMIVDRWEQRYCMLISDVIAALVSAIIALLLAMGHLKIWHIYVATAVKSCCNTLQTPAYMSAMGKLVPQKYLSKANGLIQLGKSVSQLLAPLLAGILVDTIDIQGVILVDFLSFIIAVGTLQIAKFPKSIIQDKHRAENLKNAIIYSWIYVKSRSGLLGLLILMAVTNFSIGFIEVLATPLVLSFASPTTLGIVFSIGGSGMVAGSIVISVWGNTERSIRNVFCFMLLSGTSILAAGLKANVALFALCAFLFFFGVPIIYGSIQVIFHKKVPSDIQGRVFALNSMIASSSVPLAFFMAGPLADHLFEPLLLKDGLLASTVGQIIGVGAGRGIGLMFILLGGMNILVTLLAYMYQPLKSVETSLPDMY